YMRRYFGLAGGLRVEFDEREAVAPFSIRCGELPKVADHPRVTVVMTTFNSGETVDRAIGSVLNQALSNIELIVVDDCSEDDSRDLVMKIAQQDSRVRFLHNGANSGTYVSKNRGIEIA